MGYIGVGSGRAIVWGPVAGLDARSGWGGGGFRCGEVGMRGLATGAYCGGWEGAGWATGRGQLLPDGLREKETPERLLRSGSC